MPHDLYIPVVKEGKAADQCLGQVSRVAAEIATKQVGVAFRFALTIKYPPIILIDVAHDLYGGRQSLGSLDDKQLVLFTGDPSLEKICL